MPLIICPRARCIHNRKVYGSYVCTKRLISFKRIRIINAIHYCDSYDIKRKRKQKGGGKRERKRS